MAERIATRADDGRIHREARLKWVPIPKMKVSPLAQRELNQARVDRLIANLDLEQLGTPSVNLRDASWYIIDGQHRIEALKGFGLGDEQVQCWAYEGLTEQEEAERFLQLNDVLSVDAFAKFRTGVTAGRDVECDIDRVVRAQGLVISRDSIPGAIRGVGTLRRIYTRSDGATLGRTVRIARDAFGDPGMEAAVLDGLGLLCQRYNGALEEAVAVEKLSNVHGGVNGLLGKAEILRRQTGNFKNHCVAAAAVDIINSGRGGKKLESWWK